MTKMSENLTPKQQKFADAYLGGANGNATQAARVAGYSGDSNALSQRGIELVRNSKVGKYLSKRMEKTSQKAEKAAVNVYEEFADLLRESKTALEAARSSLLVDGQIAFNPRAWEVIVAFEDLRDVDKQGNPKVKTSPLGDLLLKIEGEGSRIPLHSFVKIQDCRKTYNDMLGRVDGLLDRFAKLSGAYQQDQKNQSDIDRVVNSYRKWEADYPDAPAEEKAKWLNWFATGSGIDEAELRRVVKVQEISETVQ